MKSTLSILLLFIFLGNVIGYQIVFNQLQHNIHRETERQIEKGLPDEELVVIVTDHEEDLHWTRPYKEFRYKGEMYDVVKIKTFNNKKNYYCICDKKENNLMARYEKAHHNEKSKYSLGKHLAKINLFYQEISKTIGLTESDCIYAESIYRVLDNYILVPSLPPKKV